jgi:cytochrome c oxidase subunit 2
MIKDIGNFFQCYIKPAEYNKNYAFEDQYTFQDSVTPIMDGIINLHHDILTWLIVIITFIVWLMVSTLSNFSLFSNQFPQEIGEKQSLILEIVWTVIPSLILIMIAIPSFALLYTMDEVIDPVITVKIIGSQWYWDYEFSTSTNYDLSYPSYMIQEDDLELGELRLLEVDNRLVLPSRSHIRLLITASDVIHSWAVPSFGIKLDACPGRLNQTSLYSLKSGIYYGQCSEICGVNHAFMPIVVETVPTDDFVSWLKEKIISENSLSPQLLVTDSLPENISENISDNISDNTSENTSDSISDTYRRNYQIIYQSNLKAANDLKNIENIKDPEVLRQFIDDGIACQKAVAAIKAHQQK